MVYRGRIFCPGTRMAVLNLPLNIRVIEDSVAFIYNHLYILTEDLTKADKYYKALSKITNY